MPVQRERLEVVLVDDSRLDGFDVLDGHVLEVEDIRVGRYLDTREGRLQESHLLVRVRVVDQDPAFGVLEALEVLEEEFGGELVGDRFAQREELVRPFSCTRAEAVVSSIERIYLET